MILGETAVIRYRRSSQKSDLLDSKLLISQTLLVQLLEKMAKILQRRFQKNIMIRSCKCVAICVASIGYIGSIIDI